MFDRRYASLSNSEPVQKFSPQKLANNRSLTITCAVFSNDGRDILASYSDEDIYLFNSEDTGPDIDSRKKYAGHKNSATGEFEILKKLFKKNQLSNWGLFFAFSSERCQLLWQW